MKKIVLIVLSLLLAFSVCSCRAKEEDSEGKDSGNGKETETGIVGEEIHSDEELSEKVQTNGKGEKFRTVDTGDYNLAVYESGKVAIYYYEGTKEHVVTPSKYNGTEITEVFGAAFAQCSIESVVLSEGITYLAEGAFTRCPNLKSVTLPNSLKEIYDGAFYACPSLEEINNLKENVQKIGGFVFNETPWYENLTDEFCIVGDGILIRYNGDGGKVIIPDGVKRIVSAFCENDSITSVDFSESSLEVIGYGAFDGCTGLEEITLSESIRSLDRGAFANCTSLKTVNIEKSVVELVEAAFIGCEEIKTVNYAGTEEEWKQIAIGEGNEAITDAEIAYEVTFDSSSSD